jgi:hypothetical protein
MLTVKRVVIATVCGFIFGLICMFMATSDPNSAATLNASIKWNIVLSRTLMGFVIGISALRMNWWLHGIVLGFISSIPMGIAVMDNPWIMISTVVMGMIYGFLTELITAILFKEKPVATK